MMFRVRAASALALIAIVTLSAMPALYASAINYGNFNVPSQGLAFEDVIESSGTGPTPLFGAPTPFVVGLDFDPANFTASTTAGGVDLTDGQLNFAMQAEAGQSIGAVAISESGVFSLMGTGTAATQVVAGVNLSIVVTEIDGTPIAPVSLPSVNAWLNKNLVADPGLSQPWNLSVSVPILADLINLGYTFSVGASRIEVVIDNTLVAFSEAGSIATISKSDFRIDVTPDPNGFPSPEPTSAVLALVAMAGLRTIRRS